LRRIEGMELRKIERMELEKKRKENET